MKLKATKKQIKEGYNKIIGIGYCNAQNLLAYQNEFAYSAGSNGWACDYYDVNGVCISTGYAYIHNQNTNYDYEMLQKYESQAESIRHDYSMDFEVKKEKLTELLKAFVSECTN